MKFVKLLLVLAFITAPAWAQYEKGIDAEYVYRNHEYVLNTDGSITYNYSHKLLIKTGYAYNRAYGESFIVYNPEYQEVEVKKSATTMRDGTLAESPPNAFNEVLPRGAVSSPYYKFLRELVVTHVGLEPGAAVEFEYTVTTDEDMMPGMQGSVVIGERSPIREMNITVKVPLGKSFTYFCAGDSLEPETENESGFKVYRWSYNDIPEIEVEDHQPALERIAPVLYFSTSDKQDNIFHLTSLGSEAYYLSPEAVSFVRDAVGFFERDIEKAFVLRDWLYNTTAIMTEPLTVTGYKPLKAQKVFEEAMGNGLDRAVFLTALLNKFDIDAVTILVSGDERASEDAAMLPQFTGAMVMCPGLLPAGEALFLDPNYAQKNYVPENIIGKVYFDLTDSAEVKKFKSVYLENNTIVFESAMKPYIDGDVYYSGYLKQYGQFSPGYKRTKIIPEVEGFFGAAGYEAVIHSGDIEIETVNRVKTEFDFRAGAERPVIEEILSVELPHFEHGIAEFFVSTPTRTTQVDAVHNFSEQYRYHIQIPVDYEIASAPDTVTFKNKAGSIKIKKSVDDQYLKLQKVIEVNADRTAIETPRLINELYEIWYGRKNTHVIFRKD